MELKIKNRNRARRAGERIGRRENGWREEKGREHHSLAARLSPLGRDMENNQIMIAARKATTKSHRCRLVLLV
jgi:hypothetical protein